MCKFFEFLLKAIIAINVCITVILIEIIIIFIIILNRHMFLIIFGRKSGQFCLSSFVFFVWYMVLFLRKERSKMNLGFWSNILQQFFICAHYLLEVLLLVRIFCLWGFSYISEHLISVSHFFVSYFLFRKLFSLLFLQQISF